MVTADKMRTRNNSRELTPIDTNHQCLLAPKVFGVPGSKRPPAANKEAGE